MKKNKLFVKKIAQNVRIENHDLRRDYGMNLCAERELSTLEKKVSPQLYGMLIQQLLGFHADMQLEMAEDLVMFACTHIINTTGCPSVDMVLDVCYSWIAAEHGIIKKGYMNMFLND